MIINSKVRDVTIAGEQVTTSKMYLSRDAEEHLIKMATEHNYQQPLESGIREAVSNAVDSHTEAGVDTPVIVKLSKNALNQWDLEIIDEGLGLDEEGFCKYIMGVGESTKRDRADLLGGLRVGVVA